MKKIFLLIAAVCIWAYEAKVEPFDEFKIKSSVAGEIVKADKTLEARNVKNALAVKLDTVQNRIDLENLRNQEKFLKSQIKILNETLKRKKNTYEKYKHLKTKSQSEKDLKFYDYANTLNQLITLKSQLSTTEANIKKTEDIIKKKNIKITGYVGKIYVNAGDYAAPGMLIADVYDISRQKIAVYIPVDLEIDSKEVYINGKKGPYKIYKIWKVTDEKYVTSYKVEIAAKGLKIGDIVKVEFK